jgi:hypothetical protein
MRTPYGFECRYFYGNYFRGRKQEECRLIDLTSSLPWKSELCKSCPVPGILRANACEHMVLQGEVQKTMLGLRRKMKVTAFCSKSGEIVTEPEVGCGQCHPLPDLFKSEDTSK